MNARHNGNKANNVTECENANKATFDRKGKINKAVIRM